jgi:signal transduction histidine kinase
MQAQQPFTILYVDDESENLIVFKTTFKKHYNILTALSAKEGLEILRNQVVHVLITDQRMPEMSGVDLLEMVRREYPDCIRLLMTGYTDSESIILAINKGSVFYFIRKPWVREELFTLLEKCLSFYTLKRRRKELEHQWTRALQDLETFFYKSYHDLKGPISTQLGLLNMIKLDQSPEMTTKYLSLIEEVTLKLDRTLNKVQRLSEVLRDQVTLEAVDIYEIVREILFEFKEDIQSRGIEVLMDDDTVQIMQTDRKLIKSLLETLIENSILYMNDSQIEKEIRIVVYKANEELFFCLFDNGIGINEDVLSKVFDAFYKGTYNSKGGGLGLYLAKKITEKLHGTIELKSENGKGTEAIIRLPEMHPQLASHSV